MEIIYKLDDSPNPGDGYLYRGIQEINKGNYQEAQKYFGKRSKYDNEYASLFNAFFYYMGFGFEKRKPSESMDLFEKIAFKWNNPVAQYLIGAMYKEGDESISKDENLAVKWLLLAAENNWADAMVLLAQIYLDGIHFRRDYLGGVSWLQKVAKKDDSDTEPIDDGILYLFGTKEFELRINEPDSVVVNRATKHNIFPPAYYLDTSKSPITIEWGHQLVNICVRSILTNKKSRGVIISQISLGIMYRPGSNSILSEDNSKTTYFYKKAAKNGSEGPSFELGLDYELGSYGVPDSIEAVKWYKRTLDLQGPIEAAYRIGFIFYSGKGVKIDRKVALEYFKLRVRESDDKYAYVFMGDIYEKGRDGVPQDYILARHYFEKAYDCGERSAAVSVARFYSEGLGVRKDKNKSEELMAKSIIASSVLEKIPSLRHIMQMFDE